ncbi:hypothetical protein [Fervidicella metallireducens]|uniref:hypothetical protein n=1 Tax=Fervidicella metallireducens TaxID=655338 RepID=UPI001FA7FB15|nr:hypothetical protein [Fervidicella metallireducens]
MDFFYRDETIQVQIYDKDGKLLMDSIGVDNIKDWQNTGVKKAFQGKSIHILEQWIMIIQKLWLFIHL